MQDQEICNVPVSTRDDVRVCVCVSLQKAVGTFGSWRGGSWRTDCTNTDTVFPASQDQLHWTLTPIKWQTNMLSRDFRESGMGESAV